MKNKLSPILKGLFAGLFVIFAVAWVAQNTGYNSNQFDTATVGQVAVKSGAFFTNSSFRTAALSTGIEIDDLANSGQYLTILDNSSSSVLVVNSTSVTASKTLNLTYATPNTPAVFDGLRNLVSGSVSNVTSVTVPMGAWFVNNVGDGASITNAVALTVTNSADGWGFADAQTNAIRTRLALPYDWDGSAVKWALRCTSTATQTAPNTNVVFAVRGALIGMGDREDSVTWSSLQLVTNGLSPTAYIQTLCITKLITPGGTLQPTNSILWEIQRLGGATGDTATAAVVAVLETQLYYSRTNRVDFPTSSP